MIDRNFENKVKMILKKAKNGDMLIETDLLTNWCVVYKKEWKEFNYFGPDARFYLLKQALKTLRKSNNLYFIGNDEDFIRNFMDDVINLNNSVDTLIMNEIVDFKTQQKIPITLPRVDIKLSQQVHRR